MVGAAAAGGLSGGGLRGTGTRFAVRARQRPGQQEAKPRAGQRRQVRHGTLQVPRQPAGHRRGAEAHPRRARRAADGRTGRRGQDGAVAGVGGRVQVAEGREAGHPARHREGPRAAAAGARHVCRRRRDTPGGAATRLRSVRARPQPRGAYHRTLHAGLSAEVRQTRSKRPRHDRATTGRRPVIHLGRPGRGGPLLGQLGARSRPP